MNDQNTINAKEIRQDMYGFLNRLKSGKPMTIIYRSRPFVTVNSGAPAVSADGQPLPGSKEAIRRSLEIAEIARAQAKHILDPNKSIKELYKETMSEKYGIS